MWRRSAMLVMIGAVMGSGAALGEGPGRQVSIVGTWGFKVSSPGSPDRICFYTFRPDGTVIEDDFTPEGRPIGSGRGSSTMANNRMTIRWAGDGAVERSSIRVIDADTLAYRIVAHSGDPEQVGMELVMRRMPVGPGGGEPVPAQRPARPRTPDPSPDLDEGPHRCTTCGGGGEVHCNTCIGGTIPGTGNPYQDPPTPPAKCPNCYLGTKKCYECRGTGVVR